MLTPNNFLENKTILITGVAGFIGSALALNLLKRENTIYIIGIISVQ